ncbi:MAG: hypothetical protein ABI190_01575 [Casimicrobiaceae bacterium]
MIRYALSCVVLTIATEALAAGPNVCAVMPAAVVSTIVHQQLVGAVSDVSEEAHKYGCSYGSRVPHVSISVIRPGGAAAFDRTHARLAQAVTVAGVGDKALFEPDVGVIAVFGDTAIDAFVPSGSGTDAQRMALEKSLVTAVKNKL